MKYLLVTIVLAWGLAMTSTAHAQSGRLINEQRNGLHKTCTYDTTRGQVSKTIDGYMQCPNSLSGRTYGNSASSGVRGSNTGSKTSGLNKICFYDTARGEFTKTIRSTGICPVTAEF